MCATTGLRYGGAALDIEGNPFAPLDEREVSQEIAEWAAGSNGVMKITGKNARNMNPIILSVGGAPGLRFAWWWIWPSASGPAKYSAFNARSDNLTGRAWSQPFQRRAIVPATWYVEKGVDFAHPSGGVFGIAAITNTVREEDGSELTTYALVTRDAVGEAAGVHDRMPLVLPPDRHELWLDPERPGDGHLADAAVSWSEEVSRTMTLAGGSPAADTMLF